MPGAGSIELRLQAMEAGAAGYLEKPFDQPSLIAIIYDAVRPVHNQLEINRDDLSDLASASQAPRLKSRSLCQRLERIKTPMRRLIQFLRRRADRIPRDR
jgi:FixJ family two-component response regulator